MQQQSYKLLKKNLTTASKVDTESIGDYYSIPYTQY